MGRAHRRAARQTAALEARSGELRQDIAVIAESPRRIAERRQALFALIATAEQELAVSGDALAAAETGLRALDRENAPDPGAACRRPRGPGPPRCPPRGGRGEAPDAGPPRRRGSGGNAGRAAAAARHSGLEETPDAVRDRAPARSASRIERERLGAVNLRAEEEARGAGAQLDGIVRERDDLIAGRSAPLRQASRASTARAASACSPPSSTVNGHFQRLFTTLFGGGTAELQLIESDDPLEAGLEILARPPGKKPQTHDAAVGRRAGADGACR